MSAVNTALRIGESSSHQTCRWSSYRLAIDAQGITPLLVDIQQNYNYVELINWAGMNTPPVAHVQFGSGTSNSLLMARPGIQDPIQVLDNGSNAWMGYGVPGQQVMGGKLRVGVPADYSSTSMMVGQKPRREICSLLWTTRAKIT